MQSTCNWFLNKFIEGKVIIYSSLSFLVTNQLEKPIYKPKIRPIFIEKTLFLIYSIYFVMVLFNTF